MRWTRKGFPWVLAAAPVAGAILCIGLTLDLPEVRETPAQALPPRLLVTSAAATGGQVLRERMRLLDPTPLFLPSTVSSTRIEHSSAELEAGAVVLADYSPRFAAGRWLEGEGDLGLAVSKPAPGVTEAIGPAEIKMPFLGLGRKNIEQTKLPDRWAVVSIYTDRTHNHIGNILLPAPQGRDLPFILWSPMELFLLAQPDGIVGAPELVSSSGVPEVDEYIMDALRSTYALGGGLRPGAYRLTVGQ